MIVSAVSAPRLGAAVGTSAVPAAALTVVRVLIAASALKIVVRSEMTGMGWIRGETAEIERSAGVMGVNTTRRRL